jgi:hypothetical protein
MAGPDITLKHLVASAIHQDLLAQAELERAAGMAITARRQPSRPAVAAVRAVVAAALLRAGSWVMPNGALDGSPSPA